MQASERSVEHRYVVIDASGLILGRLASNVAKRIINGERVVIINAEKAVISGRKKDILNKIQKRMGLRTLGSQKKAPKTPRRPATFVRRTVRGMLPWKKPKGKMAYQRLKVYVGVPEDVGGTPQTLPEARKDVPRSITVEEIFKIFSWKNPIDKSQVQ